MTECARCGDCCDPVHMSVDNLDHIWGGLKGYTAGTVWYRKHLRFREFKPYGAAFDCTYFDRETRLCTAHDKRPPMCSDYPWYGKEPYADISMGGRCSFLADVPGIKMLPIVEVRPA